VLTYVNTLPLVSRENLGVFKLIAISRALENEEFLYIDREDSILCFDQVRLCSFDDRGGKIVSL